MLRKIFRIGEPKKSQETFGGDPVAIPAGFITPPTLQEQMARYMRQASEEAARAGMETLDEAEDFDVEELDPESNYELVYDEGLGKELPRNEKIKLDRDRAEFDTWSREEIKKQKQSPKQSPKKGTKDGIKDEIEE